MGKGDAEMEVLAAADAAARIPDGAVLALAGNGSILQPERLLRAIETRFVERGHPVGLTIYYPVVVGTAAGTGVDRLAHAGLVREVVASCFDIWGIDHLATMVRRNEVLAHCLPMGVMFQLLRAAADGQPGILTRIGLDTFVDPQVRGTGHNACTRATLATRLTIDGQPWLFYRAPQITAAVLCATVADEDGNLSLYQEPIRQAVLPMALAARAGGGPVIAQVRAMVRRGSLPAARVDVPACLVDAVVIDPDQTQTCLAPFDPVLTGEWALAPDPARTPAHLDSDHIVARRAAMELRPGMVINLGFGMATLVAEVVAQEGLAAAVTLSVEHGPLGGTPTPNRIFGAAASPTCILRSEDVFALYHSGQLDLAILSAAEVDAVGNANVSRFGEAMPGPGGYIDITAGTQDILLLAPLRAGGARVEVAGERLVVAREGRVPRFVPTVTERTFSARQARARGARVRYLTDRGLFALGPKGLELVEVAPGIDIQRDILDQMAFRPEVSQSPRTWPVALFTPGCMELGRLWDASSRTSH